MKVLFTSGRAFSPQNTGGVQSSTMQLASALKAEGHDVAVLCQLIGGDWTAFCSRIKRRLKGTRFSCDHVGGVPIFRAWDPTETSEVVARYRPDVAVVQSGSTMEIARSLIEHGVPVVFYYRNVELGELNGNPAELKGAGHIANSAFTAKKYADAFNIEPVVISPLVDRTKYETTTMRRNVTFINPYFHKGRDIAFELAERCPDIPFTVCESWGIDEELRTWLDDRLKRLKNVTMRKRTQDMKSIYSNAKILLAPSVWEEAWGRVATEAQFSGIPVLGSNRGGLPEAIGPGGVILSPEDPIEEWVDALRRLWDDAEFYSEKSQLALEHASRDQIKPDHQIATLVDVLQNTIAKASKQGESAREPVPDGR